MNHSILAIGIFFIVYAVLVTEKVHRSVVALLGAVAMILLGVLDAEKAFTHYIEWNTIALLIGMMILVGITNQTGIIHYIAIKSAKAAGGHPTASCSCWQCLPLCYRPYSITSQPC